MVRRLASGAEVQLGLELEQALQEGERCFSCGTCIHCDNCVVYCPDLAVRRDGDGYVVLTDYCKGCASACASADGVDGTHRRDPMNTATTRHPASAHAAHGNHAVAWAARLARPKVVPVYPITPQTRCSRS